MKQLKTIVIALSGLLVAMASKAEAPSPTIKFVRQNQSECYGVCLTSPSRQDSVVITVAHCLDNLVGGGVSSKGLRSHQAIVPSSAHKALTFENDIALLLFPPALCAHSVLPDYSQTPNKSAVFIDTISATYQATFDGYVYDSRNKNLVLARTTKPSGFPRETAGAGLFNAKNEYLGSLRNCDENNCYFSTIHDSNASASEVISHAVSDKLLPPIPVIGP